uniref:BHLH domain-containing protein n=1 Tax=Sparus aurata TaxID=8175 RepID=A0A671XNT4_SPAAU
AGGGGSTRAPERGPGCKAVRGRRALVEPVSYDALGLPFHLDTTYLDPVLGQSLPYTRFSYFSFHGLLGVCDYSFSLRSSAKGAARVRCVNEGHARLRKHLPQELKDKRLSKVESLRVAIYYINVEPSLLDLNASGMLVSLGDARKCAAGAKNRVQR